MLQWLVAVDGSAHARRALDAVARLAPQIKDGVRVLLLNVAAPMIYYGELPPFDLEGVERAQRAEQERLLAQALAEARAGGLVDVVTQAARGEPAAEIVRVASEGGVDQIVMGTHGRGAVGSLLIGSVAQRVLHLAGVPVLLVR